MPTEIEGLLIKIGADMSALQGQLQGIGTIVDATVGQALQNIGARLTASITTPLTEIGTAALKMGSEFQQSNIAFTTMLGSAEKATVFLNELRAFAATTPFEFRDLTQAATKMQALGFAAKDVLPMMRTIGDAVAGLGGGAAMIDRVTLALGQMNAKGKVSAQEMNQLAEAGIPAWDTLAKKIGISIPEAMKLAEKGALASSEAIPAILAGMNDKFAGMMEKQAQTIAGQWSNLQDKLNFVLTDIGTQMAPLAASAIQALTPMLDVVAQLAEGFKQLPPDLQIAAGGFVAIGYATGPVMETMGSLGLAIVGLKGAFGALGISAPAALAGIASAAALAAGAFLGWNIGRLMEENLKGVQDFGRGLADLIAKIPGVQSLIDKFAGLPQAQKSFGDATALLEGKLKAMGITIDKAGLSAEEYAKKLRDTALAAGDAKLAGAISTLEAKIKTKGLAVDRGKLSLQEYHEALIKADSSAGKAGVSVAGLGNHAEGAAKKAAAAAKQMAAELEGAFSKFGLKNLEKEYLDAEKALSLLRNSGKLTAEQLEIAINAVRQKWALWKTEIGAIDSFMRTSEVLGHTRWDNLIAKTLEWSIALGEAKAHTKLFEDMNTALASIEAQLAKNKLLTDPFVGDLFRMAEATKKLRAEFQTLGVTWSADLVSSANKYKGALDEVMEAFFYGEASAGDFYESQIKYLEHQIKANKASGDSWVELQEQLDSAKRKLGEFTGEGEKVTKVAASHKVAASEMSKAWGDFGKQVSTIMTDFGKGIADSIIHAKSFGDAFTKMANSLKEAFLRTVVEGAIKEVMKGLDGITSSFTGLMSNMTRGLAGLFGGGGGGGAPGGGGGGAPGLGGAITGLAGGVTGIVGAIGGIGSMISGIVGNFQNARMEKTMNAIEENTRYSKGYNLQAFEFIRDWLPWLENTAQLLRLENIERVLYEIGNNLAGGAQQSLAQPLTEIYRSLETFRETTRQQLQFISEATLATYSAVSKPGFQQVFQGGGSTPTTNPIPQTVNRNNTAPGNVTVNVQQTTQNPYTMGLQVAGALNSALPAIR